jgi:Protein of unknown function (DUF1583)
MKLLGLTLLFAQVVGGEDIYQDFRQGFVPAVFQPEGRDATRWIKTEPEGIRITLPPGSNVTSAIGMRLQTPIQGDFEITAGYEVLQVDPPTAGFGAGFAIYLATNSPTKEAVEFFHLVRPSGSEVYSIAPLTTLPDGRRGVMPGVDRTDQPVLGKAGQLRITRVGSIAVLSAARAGSDDFKRLYQFELGKEDVTALRIAVNPGNAPNPVDVRLRDFRPRFKGVTASLGTDAESDRGLRLLLVLALAVAIIVPGLLIWLYRRRAEKREGTRAA